ncbi:unnamed protein product [Arctia plantaginis]|uniref:Uncharacterized protein n=1 Tax=Arctia plantaginis TaxID=874455 RepID=A0A8S1BJD5_ARCPL|nr:unnamed protein product [Arctia plantaginis]
MTCSVPQNRLGSNTFCNQNFALTQTSNIAVAGLVGQRTRASGRGRSVRALATRKNWLECDVKWRRPDLPPQWPAFVRQLKTSTDTSDHLAQCLSFIYIMYFDEKETYLCS